MRPAHPTTPGLSSPSQRPSPRPCADSTSLVRSLGSVEEPEPMKLEAIIVNYRTAEMTLDSVHALMGALERVPNSEIVVVDNDSQDGSYQKLSRGVKALRGSSRVTVLPAEKNGGF